MCPRAPAAATGCTEAADEPLFHAYPHAALPIPTRVTPELQITLQKKNGITVLAACNVTWVSYAGDGGGIVCKLDADADMDAVFTSLTHLRFDPRLPLAHDILACQKHGVKRLQRQPQ